jgi:hypothetical protein
MYDIAISDNELHERLENLIKRRGIDLSDVKYKGKLRTSKWAMYVAAPKSKLMDYKDL